MLLSGLHPFLRSRRRSHIPRDVLGVGCPQGAPSSRTLIALNARSSATFLFPVRICCNGHESAKLQLKMETIGDKSLDNGFLCTEWLALALGVLSSQWQNWSIPMSPISTPCQIGESRGKRHDVCGARGKQIPEFGGGFRWPDNGGNPSRGNCPSPRQSHPKINHKPSALCDKPLLNLEELANEPIKIVGPIYFVGTKGLSAF